MTSPVFSLKLQTLSANLLGNLLHFQATFEYKADHTLFYQIGGCMILLMSPQSKTPLMCT